MKVLALTTATTAAGAALVDESGVLASFCVAKDRRHAEVLIPGVEFICTHAQIQLSDVDAIAVDIGPGLFTGLRVGVATAKGLALSLNKPMIAVSSLDVLAEMCACGFDEKHEGNIAAIIDGRRGEVFSAVYSHKGGELNTLRGPEVNVADVVAKEIELSATRTIAIGDGVQRHAEIFARLPNLKMSGLQAGFPSAEVLGRLALRSALQGNFNPTSEVQPLYLRQPDAKANFSAMIGPREHVETSETEQVR